MGVAVAENVLSKGGLYLDELSRKIRLLHPDFHQLTQEIVGECEEYLQCSKECGDSADELLSNLKLVSEITDHERLEVIGKRSRLLIEWTDGAREFTQTKAVLQDKLDHLERLTQHHESLVRVEQEMEETLMLLSKN